MLNIVRRSQIQGLTVMDSSTLSYLGEVMEVWLDRKGRVTYLSGVTGYLPLEQVADIANGALSTYGRLGVTAPEDLLSLHQLAVRSSTGEPLGWVEDFLFDWHTGEIAAYLLAGQIAEPLGELAVLFPEDVEELTIDHLMMREDAQKSLKSESEGLRGFLSEKSQQVQHLVKLIGDRLHYLISPHDQPEVVRVKVKQASDELATSSQHDRHALKEATDYLHDQWEGLQKNISRSEHRAKSALDSVWKSLTGKS
ncbi:MAG: photosystem reaction center subunit H [Kovacikia sp.]